jgi:hypothetical protein
LRGTLGSHGVPVRYVFVLVLSLVSGGVVYFLTLRAGGNEQLAGLGFAPRAPSRPRSHEETTPAVPAPDATQTTGTSGGEEPGADEDPPVVPTGRAGPGYTYLRVATFGPSARERLQGLVGLIVLVTVSAAVLALAVYQAGHVINQTIGHFLKSSS